MRALDIADCINDACPWSGNPVQADSLPAGCTLDSCCHSVIPAASTMDSSNSTGLKLTSKCRPAPLPLLILSSARASGRVSKACPEPVEGDVPPASGPLDTRLAPLLGMRTKDRGYGREAPHNRVRSTTVGMTG